MSYRRSRARREFEGQIAATRAELRPLHGFARRSGAGSRLLGVYYVFVYSQFEVYIKSLIEDALAAISTSPPSFDKLPDLMLGYLVHRNEDLGTSYRRFNVDEDERAILEKVSQLSRKIAAWKTGVTAISSIDANLFLEKKKYPSPKNLAQLFRRLGVDIWPVVGQAGRFNGELLLTSLNDLRTGIAHEGRLPPGFSYSDFRERIEQMKKLVAAIDRGVASHFCSTMISRSNWNTAMTSLVTPLP